MAADLSDPGTGLALDELIAGRVDTGAIERFKAWAARKGVKPAALRNSLADARRATAAA